MEAAADTHGVSALATANRVGGEMRQDSSWVDQIDTSPTDVWVTGIGMVGATIRLQQRVPAGAQVAGASEFRLALGVFLLI